jgi:protein O-GlcNAc transferase
MTTGTPQAVVSPEAVKAAAALAVGAAKFADGGQWVQAEMTARDALQADPNCTAAHHVVGLVALHLGLRDYAGECFNSALASNPYFKPAKKALAALATSEAVLPNVAPSAGTPPASAATPITIDASDSGAGRYLVIREWGYGFWADVDFALGQLLLAEFTWRQPIVHWGQESRFRRRGSAPTENAWPLYFEPIGDLAAAGLDGVAADRFPAKWNAARLDAPVFNRFDGEGSRTWSLGFLNRPERVLVADFFCGVVNALPWAPRDHPLHNATLADAYRWLSVKYLRPRPDIIAEVRAFVDQHLSGTPTLACHVRGLDKRGEFPDLDHYIDEVFTIAIATMQGEPARKLFVMSDWAGALDHFRERLGPRVVATSATRASDGTGLHRMDNADGERLGREVLIDSLIAASCDMFVGMAPSTVTGMIQFLRDWPAGTYMARGPYMLSHRNQEIYLKRVH